MVGLGGISFRKGIDSVMFMFFVFVVSIVGLFGYVDFVMLGWNVMLFEYIYVSDVFLCWFIVIVIVFVEVLLYVVLVLVVWMLLCMCDCWGVL